MPGPVNTQNPNRPNPMTRGTRGIRLQASTVSQSEGQVQHQTTAPEPKATASQPSTTKVTASSTTSQAATTHSQTSSTAASGAQSAPVKMEHQGLRAAVIQFSSKIDQITLDGAKYNIDFASYSSRRTAQKAISYLINTSQEFTNPQKPRSDGASQMRQTAYDKHSFPAQLIALGKPITVSLPDGLKSLINQNGIDLNQLRLLSSRPQGYPLPAARIESGSLILSNGLSQLLPRASLSALADAKGSVHSGSGLRLDVIPTVSFQNRQWVLQLTPVIETSIVSLNTDSEAAGPRLSPGGGESQQVLAKPELSKLYATLIKALEKLPYKDVAALNPKSAADAAVRQTPNEGMAKTETNAGSPKPGANINPQLNIKAVAPSPLAGREVSGKGMVGAAISAHTDMSGKAQLPPEILNQTQPIKEPGKQQSKPTNITGVQSALREEVNRQVANQKPEQALPVATTKQDIARSAELNREVMLSALNKAFGKAGGLPQSTEKAAEPQKSLASQLFKLLPQIQPSMLRTLALPSKVQEELVGLLHLNSLAEVNPGARASMSHMNSVSLLFQLLLGVKAMALPNRAGGTGGGKLASATQKYLQKLQGQSGVNHSILSMFDKAGTTDTMAKLVNNLNLYSHASSDSNGQVNWYFTLPYSLNQQQDQLEGNFTKESDSQDEDTEPNWRLQLKFNLVQGPLLIKTHIRNNRLEMIFNGESDSLLNRIDLLLPPLMEKLTDIGLTPDKVETRRTKVPATLLPGDHYLVKIKA